MKRNITRKQQATLMRRVGWYLTGKHVRRIYIPKRTRDTLPEFMTHRGYGIVVGCRMMTWGNERFLEVVIWDDRPTKLRYQRAYITSFNDLEIA